MTDIGKMEKNVKIQNKIVPGKRLLKKCLSLTNKYILYVWNINNCN